MKVRSRAKNVTTEKIFVMVEIVNLALRAFIDSFEINNINSLIREKLRLILLCLKLYSE